jgi:hypothetical protein
MVERRPKGSAQVVDDDVDEPRTEGALLVLLFLVLHCCLLLCVVDELVDGDWLTI